MNIEHFNPTIPPVFLLMRLRERKKYGRTNFRVQKAYPPCTNNLRRPDRAPAVPPKVHKAFTHR